MANFPPGTRVRDLATGWVGTVVAIPNYSAGLLTSWQPIPRGFPEDWNSWLINVLWDLQDGSGNQQKQSVFVPNESVVAV